MKKPPQTSARRWDLPLAGFVKINVDAAFREATRTGRRGAICRDSSHKIQFAAAGSLHAVSDALHAETLALSHAMQVAEQLGVGRVIFETDCITLQQAMSSTTYDYAQLGVVSADLNPLQLR